MTEPSQILHAASTVVVVRDGAAGLETLMLRRNDRGQFGGMWVFPGGRVDDGDADPAAPGDELAAARRAAAREAMEEAAIAVDPDTMVALAHWRPPSSVPKGFATWIFVSSADVDADVAVDGAEIHEHAWLTPAEVLRRRDAGEVTMAPPTFVSLTFLAAHPDVRAVLAAATASTPERFHTQLGTDADGTNAAFWHGDESYLGDPGVAGARHRLVMADGAWRYVRD